MNDNDRVSPGSSVSATSWRMLIRLPRLRSSGSQPTTPSDSTTWPPGTEEGEEEKGEKESNRFSSYSSSSFPTPPPLLLSHSFPTVPAMLPLPPMVLLCSRQWLDSRPHSTTTTTARPTPSASTPRPTRRCTLDSPWITRCGAQTTASILSRSRWGVGGFVWMMR